MDYRIALQDVFVRLVQRFGACGDKVFLHLTVTLGRSRSWRKASP
jgi:hypothetical protein